MELNKNMIIVGILVLLVVVSAVQVFQLIGMKSKVTDIKASGVSTTGSSAVSSSSDSGGVPTNLQNLPGMVGGC